MHHYTTYSDLQLFKLLNRGDDGAYAEIFERYGRVLINHAFRALGDEETAKDTVHDLMLHIWENKSNLKITGSLSAYLFTAVRNRVLNHLAHKKVEDRYAASFIDFTSGEYETFSEPAEENELNLLIQKEIEALPAKMREVFLMYRREELSYKDIANQLDITEHTARQQVYNAMKILKRKIGTLINFLLF